MRQRERLRHLAVAIQNTVDGSPVHLRRLRAFLWRKATRTKGRQLCEACIAGDSAAALRLIGEGGADVNFVGDVAGFTPLILAASEGADDVVRALVAAGAALNLADLSAETALIKACSEGRAATALILIEAGAAVNLPSREHKTALDHAKERQGFAQVRSALRRAGALTGAELKAGAVGKGAAEGEL